MNKKIASLMLAICFIVMANTNVFASDNPILDEILAEQEAKQLAWENEIAEIEERGIEGDRNNLLKTQVTCYIERGKPTCTGSYKMDGIIATSPEYVGRCAQVYSVAEDGGIGEFLGYYEVADTGYGAPSGYGKSIYKNRKCAGTIELGITVDFRKPDISTAMQFMKTTYTGEGTTGSQVYISLEDGKG